MEAGTVEYMVVAREEFAGGKWCRVGLVLMLTRCVACRTSFVLGSQCVMIVLCLRYRTGALSYHLMHFLRGFFFFLSMMAETCPSSQECAKVAKH